MTSVLQQFGLWSFLAGLGTFQFGLHFVEQALKNLAGRSFKKFLRHHTTNPYKGIIGGTIITALLQSSSIVSLMVLAFVGAGIIQLRNAIGIIFGSNLGTTFTGWIVAYFGFQLDIESYALPLIAIGGLSFILFSKLIKLQEVGRFFLGFGFLFLGLEFMKSSIGELADNLNMSIFEGWSPYLFFPIGFVLTAIIQSSSAAMVITLSSLHAGVIPLESAAAMVIGNDLGSTIAVILGAINGVPSKKRVALSHFLFNLIIDLLTLILLSPILYLITDVIDIYDPLITLVFFHSSFNLLGIILMLPFIGLFARFLEGRFVHDTGLLTQHIGKVPVNVPEAAIEALKKEIVLLIDRVFYLNLTALKISPGLFSFPGKVRMEEGSLFNVSTYSEDYASIKQLEGEIIAYYLDIQSEKLENEESGLINRYVHAVRNAMISAKEVKDISHNIREFEETSNDTKLSLYQFQKGQLNEFYLSLHQVFHSDKKAAYFEQLADLMNQNQINYERFLKEIYRRIEKKQLSDLEISTLLNVNREIYNANRSLILAAKDVLLTQEEAVTFNVIPEIH